MTTVKCISLAAGRRFVGLFDRSCYVSDTLDSTTLVRNGRCDRPCPGDIGLFCGGIIDLGDNTPGRRSEPDQRISRRDAPPNILLTLYGLAVLEPEISSEAALSTQTAESSSESISEPPSETATLSASSGTAVIPALGSTVMLGPNSAVSVSPTAVVEEDVNNPPATDLVTRLTTFTQPGGVVVVSEIVTRAEVAIAARETFVTTLVYTTVDPHDPSYLTVTEFCATLEYDPCHCEHQTFPTAEMTTIEAACFACGELGESTVTLTVPVGAITTAGMKGSSSDEGDYWAQHGSEAASRWRAPSLDIVAATDAGAHAEPTGYPAGQAPTIAAGSDGDDQVRASGYEGTYTAYNHASASGYEGTSAGYHQASQSEHEGIYVGNDEANGTDGHDQLSETGHEGASSGGHKVNGADGQDHSSESEHQETYPGDDEGNGVDRHDQSSETAHEGTVAVGGSASWSGLTAETNRAGSEADQEESTGESGPGSDSWSAPAAEATKAGDSAEQSGSASVAGAGATNGAPNSEPSGATDDLKVASISTANMPLSTPGSPIEVTAASPRKGMDRSVVILSYLVGLYFVL
ncbi:hypothetical protein B0T10DRAFT_561743 [Thelonectria olida]|uniref:Uncharacterized protein n=1 Tax=Thelonectria olida TaxID=1576542 RepID=A0A9P8W6H7_9HYPO|nr:hypothetical protein B0T10DRAFT_561743 [Thelonectria olida]